LGNPERQQPGQSKQEMCGKKYKDNSQNSKS